MTKKTKQIYDKLNINNIYISDLLYYFEETCKIWIFNITRSNISILDAITREYFILNKPLHNQPIKNQNNIYKLLTEFNLI